MEIVSDGRIQTLSPATSLALSPAKKSFCWFAATICWVFFAQKPSTDIYCTFHIFACFPCMGVSHHINFIIYILYTVWITCTHSCMTHSCSHIMRCFQCVALYIHCTRLQAHMCGPSTLNFAWCKLLPVAKGGRPKVRPKPSQDRWVLRSSLQLEGFFAFCTDCLFLTASWQPFRGSFGCLQVMVSPLFMWVSSQVPCHRNFLQSVHWRTQFWPPSLRIWHFHFTQPNFPVN